MRVRQALIPFAVLAVLAAAPAAAGQSAADYPRLLERFQAGDTTVDATALRMAYTRTDGYEPYDRDSDALRGMWEHLERGRHGDAAAAAEALLGVNWLDIAPHVGAMAAYRELGNDSAAALHAFAVRHLVASVGGAEDGRSDSAPMRVITTAEEYAYLNVHGLRSRSQSLGRCGGHPCDILEVTDEHGRELTLYFDVSIPYGWLGRSMGGEANEKPAGSAPAQGSRPQAYPRRRRSTRARVA